MLRASVPGAVSAAPNRFSAVLLALFLGYFFVLGPIRQVWKDHWLVTDGQRGTASITKAYWAHHGVVVYQYRVGDKVYTGLGGRNGPDPRVDPVIPEEKLPIYFSSSHPWLSATDLPRYVGIDGLPVVLLAWFFEAGLIITIIDPTSPWAFWSRGGVRTPPERGTWDLLRLIGCGVFVVLGMAVIEIGINAIFGRR